MKKDFRQGHLLTESRLHHGITDQGIALARGTAGQSEGLEWGGEGVGLC